MWGEVVQLGTGHPYHVEGYSEVTTVPSRYCAIPGVDDY
jgi:hypothetical protein